MAAHPELVKVFQCGLKWWADYLALTSLGLSLAAWLAKIFINVFLNKLTHLGFETQPQDLFSYSGKTYSSPAQLNSDTEAAVTLVKALQPCPACTVKFYETFLTGCDWPAERLSLLFFSLDIYLPIASSVWSTIVVHSASLCLALWSCCLMFDVSLLYPLSVCSF